MTEFFPAPRRPIGPGAGITDDLPGRDEAIELEYASWSRMECYNHRFGPAIERLEQHLEDARAAGKRAAKQDLVVLVLLPTVALLCVIILIAVAL